MGGARLDALLTIQDLDVLQAMVDEVYVAPELCDQLATFLTRLDSELAAATRADPGFIQTRYISTRTAVKCGRILRAACVFDRIFRAATRPLDVTLADFDLLRLHLLLTGPTPEEATRLLATEVNPIEKRQLSILRTEREIFHAVLRKLPPLTTLTPKPSPPRAEPPAESKAGVKGAATVESASASEVQASRAKGMQDELASAEARHDHAGVLRVAKMASELVRAGETAEEGHALLERATRAASTLAMRAAFEVTDTQKPVLESVRDFVELARSLEDGTTSMHKTAHWTQERALELINEVARSVAGSEAKMLSGAARGALTEPASFTASRLETLEELARMRKELLAESASRGLEPDDVAWTRAVDEAEQMLAAWWGRSFVKLMIREKQSALASVLEALGPELARLAAADERLAVIAGRPTRLKAAVVGPRLDGILEASLTATVAKRKGSLVVQIRELRDLLATHDLAAAVAPVTWLTWSARALLSAEPRLEAATAGASHTLDGYRSLRAREQRTSVSCTLAEIALLVAPAAEHHDPSAVIADLMAALSDEVKAEVSGVDIARASRAVAYLAGWIAEMEGTGLEAVAQSRLFELLWDEAALSRFAMEARLVEEVLPPSKALAGLLRSEIDALTVRAHRLGVGLLDDASAAAWKTPVA